MPKRSRNGVVSRPARVVAPTRVNFGSSIFTERAAGPFADDQVELVILHRRIEDLLDRRVEAVDLVDEEHVALFEIGELRREIARLGDDRAGGRAEIDAELARHDLRQRRLAQARRADEQHVVERIAPRLRGVDEDLEIGPRRLLAGEIVERQRPQRRLGVVLALFGCEQAALDRSRKATLQGLNGPGPSHTP